jgi:tetrahydromethanopterin S-methyltransferase subunit G
MDEEKNLEHRLTQIETKLDNICENHLKQLQHDIEVVRNWVFGIFASVILTVIGLVLHHILTSQNVGDAVKTLAGLMWR